MAWSALRALLPLIAFMLILGPVEELGWRGYATPLLQRRMAPFWAGLPDHVGLPAFQAVFLTVGPNDPAPNPEDLIGLIWT